MKTLLAFVVGAASGSFLTWMIAKKHYEKIAQEEIDSVKEVYGRAKNESVEEEPVEEPYRPTVEDKENMNKRIADLGYNTMPETEKGEAGHPYIITPEDYNSENNWYEKRTLSFWANGVISEENDGINDFTGMYNNAEVDNMIGLRNLDSMGEFEAGVLYVRNDILETDFQIVEEDGEYPVELDE